MFDSNMAVDAPEGELSQDAWSGEVGVGDLSRREIDACAFVEWVFVLVECAKVVSVDVEEVAVLVGGAARDEDGVGLAAPSDEGLAHVACGGAPAKRYAPHGFFAVVIVSQGAVDEEEGHGDGDAVMILIIAVGGKSR